MREYYKNKDFYMRRKKSYSFLDSIERYQLDSIKLAKKWRTLDELSGNANQYVLMGFWSRFILQEEINKMIRLETKVHKEKLEEALYYFSFIEPIINKHIQEKRNDIIREINLSWSDRLINWLSDKKGKIRNRNKRLESGS